MHDVNQQDISHKNTGNEKKHHLMNVELVSSPDRKRSTRLVIHTVFLIVKRRFLNLNLNPVVKLLPSLYYSLTASSLDRIATSAIYKSGLK